jgi:xylan 1,4-beta-xylosidase
MSESAVHFHCDCSKVLGPLPHFWEHTVGSCHAPLALRSDWQAQLKRCHDELGFRYVRFHGLLCDDVGMVVRYRKRLLYSFFNADQIIDFLLSIGMRPFVELSFMPEALASGRRTVFHYRGNITPPKSMKQWGMLVGKLASHWIKRYGKKEVRRWFFEVWNEPNLKIFWSGSRGQYFDLYRHTVRALRRVDPDLRVGGPATAREAWIDEFLGYCKQHRLPVDFVSTHHYPNDVIWQEDQDTETQLAHGQRDMLHDWTVATRQRCQGLPLYYTEWNCSSNGRYRRQDESYAAAFVVKTIMEAAGLVECYSFWTFSDIFEESYFPSVPFHGGFGLLSVHGIAKPVYRAFEILHRLGDRRLCVSGSHPTVDAWAVSGREAINIVLTNHALPRQPIKNQRVKLRLDSVPRPDSVTTQRIDDGHANPKKAWQEMGEPEYLSSSQIDELHKSAALVSEPYIYQFRDDGLDLKLDLPPHAVAAVILKFRTNPK